MIKQKREELIAKKPKIQFVNDGRIKLPVELLPSLNPDYDAEVEQYLLAYSEYLIRCYDTSISKDRLIRIWPIVENRGTSPATSITFELAMPSEYPIPSPFQIQDAFLAEDLENYSPCPPEEPELFVSLDLGQDLGLVSSSFLHAENSRPDNLPSNTNGPAISKRDGITFVSYKIEKLIQNRAEINFKALSMWVGDLAELTTWRIPVKIFAAELQNPLEDTIEIEFLIMSNEPE